MYVGMNGLGAAPPVLRPDQKAPTAAELACKQAGGTPGQMANCLRIARGFAPLTAAQIREQDAGQAALQACFAKSKAGALIMADGRNAVVGSPEFNACVAEEKAARLGQRAGMLGYGLLAAGAVAVVAVGYFVFGGKKTQHHAAAA